MAQLQLPQLPPLPQLGLAAADWQQFDSFFTFVVRSLGQDLSGDLREALGEAFLDARYELANVVAALRAGQNPVPQLFVNGWQRLSPIMNNALSALPQQSQEEYRNFIAAADQLVALGQPGSQLGLLQISPDVLRGMARLLEPAASGDPVSYNLDVDTALRDLLGFGATVPAPPAGTKQSRLPRLPLPFFNVEQASVASALAAEPDVKKLNSWVPQDSDLEAYLLAVRGLLSTLSEQVAGKSKLAEEHKPLYRHLVFAAGWQESCWRQFVKKGKSLAPLASASGDLGLMQVNRNTWRNIYDVKKLGGDIQYNGAAGGEILEYYLTKHALKKNEHKQPGGHLARATYAAYNGGPSHLTRYRAAKQTAELKKVDEAFWEKFQAVSAGRELDVQRCYEK
ncbi:MAG TPA: transglycosylase SLT domain-containing protein [Candidatus Binatia bacterium]|nr:transglycosylase SLT domain-containing protein [Candidatus Binatia bacterium]